MTIPKVSASASDTLDQTSYTQIDSMTLTPGAGNFLATFSMDVTYNASPLDQTLKVAIYVNGIQQQHSIRTIQQNSSLPSMTIGVVTSAYVQPTAGQVVEVRYVASSAANPMAGTTRELTLLPAEQTNYQDTDTVTDTIASGTWTTLDNMTRTPAAGDYLLVFTTSASTPADEEVGFRLSVGGSPVAHTERRVKVEGSADPSSYCTMIAASISPNGSQVVEIEWARITGSGSQSCYERNMILIEVDSADIFQATGTVDDTESTSGTDKQIDDMIINDPGANDYLVLFSSSRLYGSLAAPGATTTIKIFEGGAEDTNLTRLFEHEDSIDDTTMSVFTTGRITVAGGTDDIQAYWRGDSTDQRTMYERTLVVVGDPSPPTPETRWWFAKADSEINFTNTSYNEKHTLGFTAPAAGDYLIIVSCEATVESTSNSVLVRAQLDDTTTIMEGLAESINSQREYHQRNYSTVYLAESLASGDHFVDIDAYVEASTGYMRYMKITVLRLDDWLPTTGMYDYAATEGETTLTNSFATYQTLTFTPDVAGDYLILASCELKTDNTSNHSNVRLNYDSGSEYLPLDNTEESGNNYVGYEGKDTTDYYSFVWGGIVSLPASEKTILLEAVSEVGSTSDIRKRRIIVIRLGAMDASSNSTENTTVTNTTAQWQDKSTLTFTPASTEDYLIIGGMVIKPDSVNNPAHARLEQTVGTGTGTFSETHIDSKDSSAPADCIPYFITEVKNLGNTSQTIKTQYGYIVTSGTTYGKGSFIIAIRKPAGVASNSVTLLSDARIADTYSVQLLSDGRIADTYSVTLLSDARIQEINSVQLLSDSRIQAPVSVQLLSDGRIADTYFVQLLSDGRIKKAFSVQLLSNARIADTYSVQLLSDGRVKDTYSVQLLSDAKISLASFSVTLNSDARIKKAFSVQLLSDGRIFDVYSVQLLSDGRIKKAFSVQLLSDSRIKAPVSVRLFSDGRIFDVYSVQLLSDAKVKLTDVFSINLFSDARIKKALLVTLLSDGRIFDVYSIQLLSDSRIKKAFSVQLLSDGRIFDVYSVQLLSDGRIFDTYSVTLLSDAKITGKNQIQLLSDARIQEINSVQLLSDARIILGPIIDLHDITIIIEKHNEIIMLVEKTNEITMAVSKENEIKMIIEKEGIER